MLLSFRQHRKSLTPRTSDNTRVRIRFGSQSISGLVAEIVAQCPSLTMEGPKPHIINTITSSLFFFSRRFSSNVTQGSGPTSQLLCITSEVALELSLNIRHRILTDSDESIQTTLIMLNLLVLPTCTSYFLTGAYALPHKGQFFQDKNCVSDFFAHTQKRLW